MTKIDLNSIRQEEHRKSQTFEDIGRFLFQFSQLEFTIRVLLSSVLNLNEDQFDVVTSPYDFRVLCTVTKTILIKQLPTQENGIEDLFKRCLDLNDGRVRVAHGLWCDDGKKLTARHVARQSLKAGYFFENPDELKKLTDLAERLMHEILYVQNIPGQLPESASSKP